MLIDVHTCIGRYGDSQHTAEALDAYAGLAGLDVLLVANLAGASSPPGMVDDADEIDANAACLEACRPHRRLRPLYWVRPGRHDSNVRALLGALACEPFVGAVFAPVLNDFSADSALLDPYAEVLAARRVPAFIQTARDERAAPERIYTLARRHPTLSLVLYDALADVHRDDAIRIVQRAAQRSAGRIRLDTAGADASVVRDAVCRVGADNIVFGSGTGSAASGSGGAGDGRTLARLKELLPAAAFELVAGANAVRVIQPEAEAAATHETAGAGSR